MGFLNLTKWKLYCYSFYDNVSFQIKLYVIFKSLRNISFTNFQELSFYDNAIQSIKSAELSHQLLWSWIKTNQKKTNLREKTRKTEVKTNSKFCEKKKLCSKSRLLYEESPWMISSNSSIITTYYWPSQIGSKDWLMFE